MYPTFLHIISVHTYIHTDRRVLRSARSSTPLPTSEAAVVQETDIADVVQHPSSSALQSSDAINDDNDEDNDADKTPTNDDTLSSEINHLDGKEIDQ